MGRTEANNGITRRDFVKGLAAGAAGLGLVSILPGGIISAAAADTKKEDVGKKGDGIYIDGVAEFSQSNWWQYTAARCRPRAPGAPATSTWSPWTPTVLW